MKFEEKQYSDNSRYVVCSYVRNDKTAILWIKILLHTLPYSVLVIVSFFIFALIFVAL